MLRTFFTLIGIFICSISFAQITDSSLQSLLQIPNHYAIARTGSQMSIDGKDLESSWTNAAWSDEFEDLEGTGKKGAYSSRFKLLWDNDYLYVYARFEDDHIWAKLNEHDLPVFQDNAFEIFIDPEGDNRNYVEFQINAFAAVWDLLLTKAPRNGGASITDWDIKGLKKAVHIEGTLNNPGDKDKFWSVELAIPFHAFRYGGGSAKPKSGTVWRMNLTRVFRPVDIVNSEYIKKTGANGRLVNPAYTCWSPPGIINFHLPERWGYVRFSEANTSQYDFLSTEQEQAKLKLWKLYYLQQEYKKSTGTFAFQMSEIEKYFQNVNTSELRQIKLLSNGLQYFIELKIPEINTIYSIDQDAFFKTNVTVK